MTSPNFIARTESTSPVSKCPHPISKSKVAMREGRNYISLSHIQRLSKLINILSLIVSHSFGKSLSQEEVRRISIWWNEFKSGKTINVKVLDNEKPFDLKDEDFEDFIDHLISDVKTINQSNHNDDDDEIIDSVQKSEEPQSPDIDTLLFQEELSSPQSESQDHEELNLNIVKDEEILSPVIVPKTQKQKQKEKTKEVEKEPHSEKLSTQEDDDPSSPQSGSQDDDEPDLKKAKDEEILSPVIVPKAKKQKQKEPVLNIKLKDTKEITEELPHSEKLSTQEEKDQSLVQEDDNPSTFQFESQDHEESELETIEAKDEEITVAVTIPEEPKKQEPKEPVLNIIPKDKTKEIKEEFSHSDVSSLIPEEYLQSIYDEDEDQFTSNDESQDHEASDIEKPTLVNEQNLPREVIVEELDIYEVDQFAIRLKRIPKKQQFRLTQEDSSNVKKQNECVEDVDLTDEVELSEEDSIEVSFKKDEIALKEKIKAISHVINDDAVKAWLKTAENHFLLNKTNLYENLQNISSKLNQKQALEEKAFQEMLIQQYIDYEDKILEIRNYPAEQINKLIQRQESEFVFKFIKDNEVTFKDIIPHLKDHAHGKFKANLHALLNLVSNPSISLLLASELDEEQSLEKSIHLNEVALKATLKSNDPAKDFEDFENQINQDSNQSSKEAFMIFVEILQAGATLKNIKSKLINYNDTEAAVRKAIVDLANPLQNIANDSSAKQLPTTLETINQIFKSIPNLEKKPFLKNLLIQNTHNGATAFLVLQNKKETILFGDQLTLKIDLAIHFLKTHLGVEEKERLNFIIHLGKKVLASPDKFFNQYLETQGVFRFTQNPPHDSSKIEDFLKTINNYLDQKTYTAEELLALEAFTSIALYSYIINPQSKIDSSFQPIVGILTTIRAKTDKKLRDKAVADEVEQLRKSEQNQNFYKFLKKEIENTSSYPKDFWFDPKAIKKMTIADSLLRAIGNKIASPDISPHEPAQLVHKNDNVGYEIYFYPAESEKEKSKLLIFFTKPFSCATFQGMNHQLGLYGDSNILKSAQEVISNMTSTDVLEGYQQDLKEGNLDIIASGFDNSGAAASIVGNKLAQLYPKTTVTSISAGSTTIVTTEDAYNMNQAENFFSIRLKYVCDRNVDRTLSNLTGDFSVDSYHTFPLLVTYNKNSIDIDKHNKEEYGNVNHFIPAMKNPLLLRRLYQNISDQIIYDIEFESLASPATSLSQSLVESSAFFDYEMITPEERLYIGQIDDLIELGDHIRDNIEAYKDAFLKLDKHKLSTSHKKEQLAEFEKTKKEQNKVEEKTQNGGFNFFGWGAKQPTTAPIVQKSFLTLEEQDNTIHALQQTIIYLKDSKVMDLITPQKAISLLVATDTLLINYTKINTNVGKLPQLVDLINEIRELASNRLEVLYEDEETQDTVISLFEQEGANLVTLANNVLSLNTHYEDLFDEKTDVLGKIDYESRFLEYLGFKIAVQGQDKLGSESYVSKLHTNKKDNFDISLFTPENPNKKQRIVICCNGKDTLGSHAIVTGDFGAGDSSIIKRAETLSKLIIKQLEEQFKQHHFNASDVDIVITGFGAEGAVATAVGYSLSSKLEKQGCQIQSIGFGAPKFTTKEGADLIRSRPNFVPIRFLSPNDKLSDWKFYEGMDFNLSHDTYYTIPFQFRIVGTFETNHNPNLYGDIQGIKTSMKTAYQMREVANDKNKALMLEKSLEAVLLDKQPSQPIRINLDTRKASLIDFSQKSAADLKKIEPGKLIGIMKFCVELSERDTITDQDEQYINQFFSTFIEAIKNDDINETHSIDNPFYKKMVAHGYKPNQIFGGKWKIQKIISKDLRDAIKAIKNADQDINSKTKNELILKRDYYRGILAGDLNGNRYKPAGGGVNGAVFFKHLESGLKKDKALLSDEKTHRPFLGVFKPHPETVREFKGWFDATQWGERIKAIAGMDSYLNKSDPNSRVNNEIFAYELFHIFGFNAYVGFPTTLKVLNKNDIKERPASFCNFIPGLDIVALHVENVSKSDSKSNILNHKRHYNDQELHIWEMSKIFDYLTGNMDGHEGNAFIEVNEQGRVIGAVNFDYDKAFAVDGVQNIGNQYKWANLRISKQNITSSTKKALTKMLTSQHTEKNIQAFLAIARQNGAHNQHFTDKQEILLRQRIKILKKIVSGEIKKLSELGKYKIIK